MNLRPTENTRSTKTWTKMKTETNRGKMSKENKVSMPRHEK